jgi:hypothetical protein
MVLRWVKASWRVASVATLVVGAAGAVFAATRPDHEERARALFTAEVARFDAGLAAPGGDPESHALRALNPEWDFMRKVFLGMTLADDALAHPERADEDLRRIDALLDGLLADEAAHGHTWFLLPYAHAKPWKGDGRSLFVDGELAMLAGARRLVRDDDRIRALHQERVALVERAFAEAPRGLPESYPDEAWLFCVTNALVALRMSDALDGTDHRDLLAGWVAEARAGLVEPGTGLLGSSYRVDGAPLDGPEGSTVWLVATNLLLIDPVLAREQYERASVALLHDLAGLAWASEWGPGWQGPVDVDSGPIVPLVDASPSSSGFAILAARAFGDEWTFAALTRSLGAADLVVQLDPRLAVLADNAMGNTIVLHGLTFGPLWERLGPPPPGLPTLGETYPPPAGAVRVPTDAFGRALLALPLRPEGTRVVTHDGRTVAGHAGRVVDLPLVPGDLQQCADSAIRLRAEWLLATGRSPAFHATSGDLMPWARYQAGERPLSVGRGLVWRPATSAARFDDYLADVFRWAGTRSLALDTEAASDPRGGDLLVSPGSPGHAVVLLDVARRGDEQFVLVGEGYMPAMSFHVEAGTEAGWWRWDDGIALDHWTLPASSLRRWRQVGDPAP